mgnify:CR=1 FL=1
MQICMAWSQEGGYRMKCLFCEDTYTEQALAELDKEPSRD